VPSVLVYSLFISSFFCAVSGVVAGGVFSFIISDGIHHVITTVSIVAFTFLNI
jgi:hypothetical protein